MCENIFLDGIEEQQKRTYVNKWTIWSEKLESSICVQRRGSQARYGVDESLPRVYPLGFDCIACRRSPGARGPIERGPTFSKLGCPSSTGDPLVSGRAGDAKNADLNHTRKHLRNRSLGRGAPPQKR
jgi:hypothetical protein